ncbi:hypothetical protein [Salinibius halmophilus]|uniref:hypothetical protein n=1 Tax=Salinibius halmophilus TaxID=1853216 RepID=UPI000E6651D7|nr:hypothetical protein [Salinibius halmophilus]
MKSKVTSFVKYNLMVILTFIFIGCASIDSGRFNAEFRIIAKQDSIKETGFTRFCDRASAVKVECNALEWRRYQSIGGKLDRLKEIVDVDGIYLYVPVILETGEEYLYKIEREAYSNQVLSSVEAQFLNEAIVEKVVVGSSSALNKESEYPKSELLFEGSEVIVVRRSRDSEVYFINGRPYPERNIENARLAAKYLGNNHLVAEEYFSLDMEYDEIDSVLEYSDFTVGNNEFSFNAIVFISENRIGVFPYVMGTKIKDLPIETTVAYGDVRIHGKVDIDDTVDDLLGDDQDGLFPISVDEDLIDTLELLSNIEGAVFRVRSPLGYVDLKFSSDDRQKLAKLAFTLRVAGY